MNTIIAQSIEDRQETQSQQTAEHDHLQGAPVAIFDYMRREEIAAAMTEAYPQAEKVIGRGLEIAHEVEIDGDAANISGYIVELGNGQSNCECKSFNYSTGTALVQHSEDGRELKICKHVAALAIVRKERKILAESLAGELFPNPDQPIIDYFAEHGHTEYGFPKFKGHHGDFADELNYLMSEWYAGDERAGNYYHYENDEANADSANAYAIYETAYQMVKARGAAETSHETQPAKELAAELFPLTANADHMLLQATADGYAIDGAKLVNGQLSSIGINADGIPAGGLLLKKADYGIETQTKTRGLFAGTSVLRVWKAGEVS